MMLAACDRPVTPQTVQQTSAIEDADVQESIVLFGVLDNVQTCRIARDIENKDPTPNGLVDLSFVFTSDNNFQIRPMVSGERIEDSRPIRPPRNMRLS